MTTGIPAEVGLLLVPVMGAIGTIWYLGWKAVTAFQEEGRQATVARLPQRDGEDEDAAA